MPFHDYQQRFRRDRVQQLVQALDAANAVAILKQLSLFQPAATAASIFEQYSQLPFLLAELLARLAARGVASALMPASLVKAWQALAVLRSRSEVSAHLRGRSILASLSLRPTLQQADLCMSPLKEITNRSTKYWKGSSQGFT